MNIPGKGSLAAPSATNLPKVPSGIEGFDVISEGGVPAGRTTLVAGTAGSGKTIFACQFLASGIRDSGENGMHIGEKLGRIHGLLWGSPSHLDPEMVEKIQSFTEPGSAN